MTSIHIFQCPHIFHIYGAKKNQNNPPEKTTVTYLLSPAAPVRPVYYMTQLSCQLKEVRHITLSASTRPPPRGPIKTTPTFHETHYQCPQIKRTFNSSENSCLELRLLTEQLKELSIKWRSGVGNMYIF